MTDMPTVAGQNSLARALDGLLATQLDTGSPLEIVCEWHSVAALQERSRRGTDPWLLIERVDNGGCFGQARPVSSASWNGVGRTADGCVSQSALH